MHPRVLVHALAQPRQHRVPLRLDRLDLHKQQLEPVELAADLRPQLLGQLTPVRRAQRLQPRPSIAPQRGIARDPLRQQKSLDPVDMPDPLVEQDLALTADPAAVLFLGARGSTIEHTRGSPRL